MDIFTYRRKMGANIKRARWAAGMTQEEAAAPVLSFKYYQALEAGAVNPTVSTLFSLARHLKTTIAAIVDVDPVATSRARERMAAATPPQRGRKPKRQPRRWPAI